MFVPQTLKDRCEAELTRCIDVVSKKYNRSFNRPRIAYDVRGTRAGFASSRDSWGVVHLNPILLVENPDEMVKVTLPHEFAHIVDHIVFPQRKVVGVSRRGRLKRSIHGPTWQSVMYTLGADPERTHNMDTTNARVKKVRRVPHTCPGCKKEMNVGPKHAKRVRQADTLGMMSPIVCKTCRTPVSFKMTSPLESSKPFFALAQGPSHPINESKNYKGTVIEPFNMPPLKVVQIELVEENGVDVAHIVDPLVPPPTVREMTGKSKIDHAVKLMKNNPKMTRQETIKMFIEELQMSSAGASTYYYKARKKIQES